MEVVAPPETAEADAAPRGPEESLEAYVCRLARVKAQAVAELVASGTILACDTLSEVDGRPLGKPADRSEAERMLRSLSGRIHRVVTGVCLWQRPGSPPLGAHAESILEMDPLDDGFLAWYLDSGMWQGKAGGCGYQDERLPLRVLRGSESNVVGLPLELVRVLLATIGQ